jgi:hypothetical protein
MPLVVDPYTTRLLAGDTGRGDVWGLNLNLASPPPEALRAPYERLAAAVAAQPALADPAAGVYVYPFHTLHITCASPAPFTHARVPPSERAAFTAAWAAALREACTPEAGFPTAPFPLVYGRPTLEEAAAIFRCADPTGAVGRIRACIRAAATARPELLAAHGFRTPNIVHVSFLRFGGAAPPADEAAVRAAYADAAQSWPEEGVTVWCDALRLVDECAIYMHLHLEGADGDMVRDVLPFAGRGAPAGGSD